jgi:hypothetical protein
MLGKGMCFLAREPVLQYNIEVLDNLFQTGSFCYQIASMADKGAQLSFRLCSRPNPGDYYVRYNA